jgi:hypothetical protein
MILPSERVHLHKNGKDSEIQGPRLLSRRIRPSEASWSCRENDCKEPVQFFCNSNGQESLMCDFHNQEFRERHKNVPMHKWLSRELQREKKSEKEIRFILVWNVPIQGASRFGGLSWIWYPCVTGRRLFYRIHKEKVAIDLPLNVRWEQITQEESKRLIGQLLNEKRLGFVPQIVGFASDAPFDRPDISLGYSVRNNARPTSFRDMREAYPFQYSVRCSDEKMEELWCCDVISFYPTENGTITGEKFGPIPE